MSKGIEMDKEWMAEDDLRTLIRAEEIKKDAKRYAAAKAMAKKRKAEMEVIAKMAKD